MVLIEWDTPEKQADLLEILRKDGIGIPNNLVMVTSIRYAIERRLPTSLVRFFTSTSDDDATPTYVFVVEENSMKFCDIYARPPARGHDLKLLEESLGELLDITKERLERDGRMRVLSDTTTRQMLLERFSEAYEVSADAASAAVFYMTDEQLRAVNEIETPTIDGFCIDSFNLEKDSRKIHANWSFSVSEEATAACFQHLPSVIVRDSCTGEAVAWEMSSPFGACSNLFTLLAFRCRGLAKMAEMHLVKTVCTSRFASVQICRFHTSSSACVDKRKSAVDVLGGA